MPTNANTFNSRVTSEALEAKFREVFPSQGGAELVQDLFASGVIQPVVDFSAVAEGDILSPDLQQAWDFATTQYQVTSAATTTLANTAGFWRVDLVGPGFVASTPAQDVQIKISDGVSTKIVWRTTAVAGTTIAGTITEDNFIVFLRSGDTLQATNTLGNAFSMWTRQIADVYGNPVNPLGYVPQ